MWRAFGQKGAAGAAAGLASLPAVAECRAPSTSQQSAGTLRKGPPKVRVKTFPRACSASCDTLLACASKHDQQSRIVESHAVACDLRASRACGHLVMGNVSPGPRSSALQCLARNTSAAQACNFVAIATGQSELLLPFQWDTYCDPVSNCGPSPFLLTSPGVRPAGERPIGAGVFRELVLATSDRGAAWPSRSPRCVLS